MLLSQSVLITTRLIPIFHFLRDVDEDLCKNPVAEAQIQHILTMVWAWTLMLWDTGIVTAMKNGNEQFLRHTRVSTRPHQKSLYWHFSLRVIGSIWFRWLRQIAQSLNSKLDCLHSCFICDYSNMICMIEIWYLFKAVLWKLQFRPIIFSIIRLFLLWGSECQPKTQIDWLLTEDDTHFQIS